MEFKMVYILLRLYQEYSTENEPLELDMSETVTYN